MQKIDVMSNETLIAHVFRHDNKELEGIQFLTPNEYPLQVGIMKYGDGKDVKAHRHVHMKYNVDTTQEFLYVESGQIDIIFYDDDRNKISAFTLDAGEFILSVGGGHEIKIHPGSKILEVKQGPYPGDANAKIFKN